MIAVVERDPDLGVGRRVEKPASARIFANRVRHRAGGDAIVDLGPGAAAVVRAPEVRIVVVDTKRVRGGVRGAIIEMSRLDVEDARPGLDGGGRHVGPGHSGVRRCLNTAVIGAGPEHAGSARRW